MEMLLPNKNSIHPQCSRLWNTKDKAPLRPINLQIIDVHGFPNLGTQSRSSYSGPKEQSNWCASRYCTVCFGLLKSFHLEEQSLRLVSARVITVLKRAIASPQYEHAIYCTHFWHCIETIIQNLCSLIIQRTHVNTLKSNLVLELKTDGLHYLILWFIKVQSSTDWASKMCMIILSIKIGMIEKWLNEHSMIQS